MKKPLPYFLIFLTSVTLSNGQPQDPSPSPPPDVSGRPVDWKKELIITSTSVVDSDRARKTGGPWHIRTLFEHLAGGREPSQLMLQYLREWENEGKVDETSFKIPARGRIREMIIDPWLQASGASGKPDQDVKLNWEKAPFRLLAIVNRPDLGRADMDLKMVEHAGEGRFVFGVLNKDLKTAEPFTIIFEYRMQANNAAQMQNWAKAWHALSKHQNFDDSYLADLEKITMKFSSRGIHPGRANGSALNQLRTNEIMLANPWELREFHLLADSHNGARLHPVTVKDNPDLSFVGKKQLTDFINDPLSPVPAQFEGEDFLAASSINPIPRVVWKAPDSSELKQRNFGVLTCNGCHGTDGGMGPFEFTHVQVREPNVESQLSGFLTGVSPGTAVASPGLPAPQEFTDPRNPVQKLPFAQDLLQRQKRLLSLADPSSAPAAPGEPLWENLRSRVH